MDRNAVRVVFLLRAGIAPRPLEPQEESKFSYILKTF